MGWVVVRLRRFVRRWSLLAWLGAEAASVAMIFAIAMLPMMAATGAAVDLSRALWVRARLSQALDAAGLAVGATPNLDQSQTQDLADKYFVANYPTSDLGTPSPLNVSVNGNVVDLSATAELDTTLMALFGIDHLNVGVSSQITRESKDLEIAVALDTTGSMCSPNAQPCPSNGAGYSDTRIAALQNAANQLIDLVVQDVQTPTYSKMAIVPWAMAVNVGAVADQVRGPVAPGLNITNATWAASAPMNITGATRASPVVITSANHGFVNGDRVFIQGIPSGMTQINNKQFTVASATTNTFALQGINGTGYNSYTSGGTVTKCQMSDCSATITTSTSHGFVNGNHVYITNVGGMTQLNNATYTVANATSTTLDLVGSVPPYSAYTTGGSVYCTNLGCQYYYFQNASGSWNTWQVSTCVSERTANAFTDASPATTYLGYNYAGTNNPCIAQTVVPLTSDKSVLHDAVNNLVAKGSTAGHIGSAWAWYMISPNFASLWPTDSQPATYGTQNVLKVAVLMTDGLYNSPYCNGVIAKDATSGSGGSSDHINCNAPNSDSYTQAENICDGMKQQGIIIYAVGFDIANDANAQHIMNYCAMDQNHVYLPNNSSDLAAAFVAIGQDVTALRISQ
ncbi:MAG TPA: ubiquitin-activating E1 FCCH domain-containing protein [Alphaproteobacteria bacterium]|nr:ubiquitin-activating E1 FCCH domain-containing protein [Alphaproteobacteria bacterium]